MALHMDNGGRNHTGYDHPITSANYLSFRESDITKHRHLIYVIRKMITFDWKMMIYVREKVAIEMSEWVLNCNAWIANGDTNGIIVCLNKWNEWSCKLPVMVCYCIDCIGNVFDWFTETPWMFNFVYFGWNDSIFGFRLNFISFIPLAHIA